MARNDVAAERQRQKELIANTKQICEAIDGKQLAKAKDLINAFCRSEYQSEADFSDLKHIGIAYTELGDENEHPIQVEINLVNNSVNTYLHGYLVESLNYLNLKELTSDCLEYLNFEDLVFSIDLDATLERIERGKDTRFLVEKDPKEPCYEKVPTPIETTEKTNKTAPQKKRNDEPER